MKRVVYTSVAVNPMGCLSNIDILRTSRAYNHAFGITGFLIRSRRVFAQVLEGPDRNLDALVNVIRRDERHWGMCTWENGEVEERLFPEWTMALAFSDDEDLFERLFNPNRTSARPRIDQLKQKIRQAADAYARAEETVDR